MIESILDFEHIIEEIHIEKLIEDNDTHAFKARLILKNQSILIIKDYRFIDGSRKYSFHWMYEIGKLIIRWDNEPHWKNIDTFPHHKHIDKNENVYASFEITLPLILKQIETIIVP